MNLDQAAGKQARMTSAAARLPRLKLALSKKASQIVAAEEGDPRLARWRERAAELQAAIKEIETKGFTGPDVPVGVFVGVTGPGVQPEG